MRPPSELVFGLLALTLGCQGDKTGGHNAGGGTPPSDAGTAPTGGTKPNVGGSGSGGGAGQVAGGASAVSEHDWPMMGRDLANTRASSDTTISRDNVGRLEVAKRAAGSGVASNPAIFQGTAYYADYAGHLKAVDAVTGSVLWDTLVQRAEDVGEVPATTTVSPFVTAGRAYMAGNAGWVYAVDRTSGEVAWRAQVEPTIYSRISSSPIVVGSTLIIGTGSYQVFRAGSVPIDQVFRGSIVGLNAETGETLWRTSVCESVSCGSGISVWSSAAVDEGAKLAFIGTGQAYTDPAGELSDALLALDYETGALVWSQQFTADDVFSSSAPAAAPGGKNEDIGAVPNLFEASIDGATVELVGVGDKGGRYRAFERKTGTPVWSADLGFGSAIGGIMQSAAFGEGALYAVSNTSMTFGEGENATVPGTAIVVALDASTGDVKWETELSAGSFSGVTFANGLVYLTTWDGALRVLGASDGALVASIPLGEGEGQYVAAPTDGFPDGSVSGPAISDGRIYAGYGWAWGTSITGGLAILELGDEQEPEPTDAWTPSCPDGFVPKSGINTGFPTPTGERSFSLNLPGDTTTPRPVWLPLTGSVESTNENLDARGGNRKLTSEGYIVIGPVRRCAGTVDGAGTAVSGGACNTTGSGGWNWNPWNDGRAFGAAGEPWKDDEGPDSAFFEAVVKCVATAYPVDQKRLYLGGISAGGTMTNRALTFRSDFWAGGMPISGEWYVTRPDGTSYGGDDFTTRRSAVAASPDAIFQGRIGPFPLKTALEPMIVITVWGGEDDIWYCGPTLCADYRPSTQVGSSYFASMPNVVHVACSSSHGHQWPTINSDAFNSWALKTLSSHPKGTAKEDFVLTPPPAGYACQVGAFTDHY